jgi:hypothetical protein
MRARKGFVARRLQRRLVVGPVARRVTLATLCVTIGLVGVSAVGVAAHNAGASSPTLGPVTKKLIACERVKKVCNPAAWRRLPLRGADPAGATLLTEAQAIAQVGWQSGDSVGAVQMTYGQAEAAYPGLASSNVTDPSRVVWVITRQLAKPVRGRSLRLPAGQPVPMISAVTVVIDAATGNETDVCVGCASVPVSAAATRIASSQH